MKYRIFTRDPRAQLLVDDCTGFRYLMIYGTVDVREDLAAELPLFRAIRQKHGRDVPPDDELLAGLKAEQRVLLAITPMARRQRGRRADSAEPGAADPVGRPAHEDPGPLTG